MEVLTEMRLAKVSEEKNNTLKALNMLLELPGVTLDEIYIESIDFICKFIFGNNSKILLDIYKLIELHRVTKVKSIKKTVINLIQYIQCRCVKNSIVNDVSIVYDLLKTKLTYNNPLQVIENAIITKNETEALLCTCYYYETCVQDKKNNGQVDDFFKVLKTKSPTLEIIYNLCTNGFTCRSLFIACIMCITRKIGYTNMDKNITNEFYKSNTDTAIDDGLDYDPNQLMTFSEVYTQYLHKGESGYNNIFRQLINYTLDFVGDCHIKRGEIYNTFNKQFSESCTEDTLKSVCKFFSNHYDFLDNKIKLAPVIPIVMDQTNDDEGDEGGDEGGEDGSVVTTSKTKSSGRKSNIEVSDYTESYKKIFGYTPKKNITVKKKKNKKKKKKKKNSSEIKKIKSKKALDSDEEIPVPLSVRGEESLDRGEELLDRGEESLSVRGEELLSVHGEETRRPPRRGRGEETHRPQRRDRGEETRRQPQSDLEEETRRQPQSDLEEETRRQPQSDLEEETRRQPQSDLEEETRKQPPSNLEEETRKQPPSNLEEETNSLPQDQQFTKYLKLRTISEKHNLIYAEQGNYKRMKYINDTANSLGIYNAKLKTSDRNIQLILKTDVLSFGGYIKFLKDNMKKITPGFIMNYVKIVCFLYCIGVTLTEGSLNDYIIVTPTGILVHLSNFKLNKTMRDVSKPSDIFQIEDVAWANLISNFMRENKKTIVNFLYEWDKKLKTSMETNPYEIFKQNLLKCIKF